MTKRIVLVVDDENINRKILCKLLQSEYSIIEAANGSEALSALHENSGRISAVLLDIVMPVMDGYEVLKIMAADQQLSKIPVIVSSQKDGDEAEIKALSLGAQDFIAKPYKAEIIRRRLSNIIKFRETASLINKVEKDELTGLYNKQFFIKNVSERLRQPGDMRYDLICIGIERFRLINEAFGVARGDELLRYIADLLRTAQRPIFAARFTADLFFMLLPHRDKYDASVLQSWYGKVNEFPIGMEIKLHCGIYEIEDGDIPVSVMCDRAQLASEKNKGMYDSPFFLYDNSLRQKLLAEQFITGNMRKALEERQYQVYYQPKYDLKNERIAGAEALVRWIHPERGSLSPGLFIPLFERNGFISELDQYVWDCACRDIRYFFDAGLPPVAVSVNVSRADIYNPQLPQILLDLLAKYNVPIRYLHLEITESAYTDNPDQIIRAVSQLRRLGFTIEMDDFGSGYSSLNMLAEMPVDVLKLDMHFIQSETCKTSGKGILSFVISLAKWLDLAVVAEGVETGEQIATLRSMDCNYVQGFYYAKPMQRDDFEALLKNTATTEMICNSQTARSFTAAEEPHAQYCGEREMLIVDDMEFNRAVLAGSFDSDYKIIEKDNGSDAWDYLNEHYANVDIIMLDLIMPLMDGFQLLERIRADIRMKDLPVIITSQGDAKNERRALQMLADDFISKPYNPEIIRHRVNNVIASHKLNRLNKNTLSGTLAEISSLKPYFDIVRLVEPEHTLVCGENEKDCNIHACYAVWGKATRCSNCISLKALKNKSRYSKLEYSENGLYFVIAQYVPYEGSGAVIEMVTKLDDEYVDNVFDKKLLYANLDSINKQLDNDELTGIFNRRYIDTHLPEYIEEAKESGFDVGVAMIDIDFFKRLNDEYGHLAGDEVLKAVAKLLEENISVKRGDFAARFGGDEFLIVCRHVGPDVLRRRLESIIELAGHIAPGRIENIKIGISGGCVCLSEFPESSAMELIDRADKRLYKAKGSSRGHIVGR